MGLDVQELVIGVSLGTLDTLFTVHMSPLNVYIQECQKRGGSWYKCLGGWGPLL